MPGRQRDALALPEGFTAADDAEKEKTQHDFQVCAGLMLNKSTFIGKMFMC